MRRVLQHQGPGLVERITRLDAAQGGDRLRQALERPAGREVTLLVGHPYRQRAHQDVRARRGAQFAPPSRPPVRGQRRQVVIEAGKPDEGAVEPAAGAPNGRAQGRLR